MHLNLLNVRQIISNMDHKNVYFHALLVSLPHQRMDCYGQILIRLPIVKVVLIMFVFQVIVADSRIHCSISLDLFMSA